MIMMKLLECVVIFASLLNVTPGMANHFPLQVVQAPSGSSIQGYCFSVATNDGLDSTARIYIQGNQVTGRVEATIQNEQESYYTSYNQTLHLDVNFRFFEYGTSGLSKTTLFSFSNPVCTRN